MSLSGLVEHSQTPIHWNTTEKYGGDCLDVQLCNIPMTKCSYGTNEDDIDDGNELSAHK